MADWRDRLVEERAQLADRVHKLSNFVLTPTAMELPEVEHHLLTTQLDAMNAYLAILDQRLVLYGLA